MAGGSDEKCFAIFAQCLEQWILKAFSQFQYATSFAGDLVSCNGETIGDDLCVCLRDEVVR